MIMTGKTEVLGEKHYTAWVVDGWMRRLGLFGREKKLNVCSESCVLEGSILTKYHGVGWAVFWRKFCG